MLRATGCPSSHVTPQRPAAGSVAGTPTAISGWAPRWQRPPPTAAGRISPELRRRRKRLAIALSPGSAAAAAGSHIGLRAFLAQQFRSQNVGVPEGQGGRHTKEECRAGRQMSQGPMGPAGQRRGHGSSWPAARPSLVALCCLAVVALAAVALQGGGSVEAASGVSHAQRWQGARAQHTDRHAARRHPTERSLADGQRSAAAPAAARQAPFFQRARRGT